MFKNKKRFLALVLALAATLLLVSIAYADNGALVLIHGDGCTVYDLDWQLVDVEGNPSGDGAIIITNNANGTWNATCHGTLPEGSRLPKRAVVRYPEEAPFFTRCGVPFLTPTYTRDYKTIIQPSGRVTLSCHFGPNSEGGSW